tara:strand:- start:311 stop:598 length:288 start_codon:yes stop_codon:yes gene_type:complete
MSEKEKNKGIWNGGKTNKFNEMIRESEDFHDTIDSELDDRDDLKERQKIMDKTKIKRPLHEYYENINNFEKFGKTKVSLMGGVQRRMGYDTGEDE